MRRAQEEEAEEKMKNSTGGGAWRVLSLEETLPSLEEGVLPQPSVEDFACILQNCRKERDKVNALRLHAHMCKSGVEAHTSLGNYLVSMLVAVGSMHDAQQVFNRLVYRSELSWNSLITGYIERGKPQHAFALYQKMQMDDAVHPSGHAFVALLKACAKLKDLERGLKIHAEVSKVGLLKRNLFVGSTLVDMYAKCGSLAKAQQVFDDLPIRDIVSWTALITGYAEQGHGKEALKCFEQMQLEGVTPNAVTFLCSLKACASIGATDKGQEIHAEIERRGLLARDLFVGSTLVDMYAKCGLLAIAKQVFDKLPVRDVVSWTALIAGYAEHGHGEEALKCFEQMQLQGVSLNAATLVCSLKACGSIGATEKGQEIHVEIEKQGLLETDLVVGNTLVDMYAKCGWLGMAQKVFDKLPVRNVVSWTMLIAGYAEQGHAEKALKCFELMQLEGVPPNAVTFVCSLKACSSIGAIAKGQEIHAEIERQGLLERDLVVGNTLVDMYAKCGLLSKAQQVFDRLSARNVVSWNALIAGYAEHVHGKEAVNCFEQMQSEGVSPNAVTFVCILKACGSIGATDKGREIQAEVERQGLLERDLFVGSALVDMYAKCGLLAIAQQVFDKLPVRCVVSWTALITGYTEHGHGEEALKCFEQMQLQGVSPNASTLVCSLKACGQIGASYKGREIHAETERQGLLERDPVVGSTLVDMYAKCGSLAKAQEVFDKLPVQNIVCWNALMTGYAEHGHGEETLKCFEQMQLEGVCPDAVTFVCSLRACGSIGAIGKGKEIHAEIERRGLLKGDLVGNTLVDMYAKCGSLAIAQQVFDKLPDRDVVSWNALIAGYGEHGQGEEAVKCFEQMQLEGVSPNTVTFVCSLKACGSIGAMDKGREIHAEIERWGLLERDLAVGIALVNMYAKCGSVAKAQQVFDKLQVRTVVSWNALIAGYAKQGHGKEALKCFEQMQLEGVSPDAVTLLCSLKACGSIGATDKGQKIHAEIERKGLLRDVIVGNALVHMYAKCGLLAIAQQVFDKLPVRDVVSWAALIAGYTEHGHGDEALKCFEQMQLEGVFPNAFTFVCSLKACGSMGATDKGQEIHNDIERQGLLKTDLVVGNTLVDMYARCGLLAKAQEVFDRLPVRNVVSWNALITGYAEHGHGEEAVKCFEHMQLEGVSPDAITFVCSLKACGSIGATTKGHEIHAEIERQGLLERDLFVGSTLVDMYAKCGSLAKAQQVFDKLPARNVVSWNALMAAYAKLGHGEEAVQCFKQMQLEGVSPNAVTFVCSLKACGSIGAPEKGGEFHAEIERRGLMERGLVGNTLVNMYIKCGLLTKAQQVFDNLPVRDVVSWTTLMAGYAQLGESAIVFHIFDRMVGEGIKPDPVTFIVILSACSDTGLVNKSQSYFEAMCKDYGIVPTLEHHTCMVDILGRAGQLDKAVTMIKKMPFCPNVVVWHTVLGACRNWGNVEFGKLAFEHAVHLDEQDAVAYVLMSHIYADADWQEEVNKVEAMRSVKMSIEEARTLLVV